MSEQQPYINLSKLAADLAAKGTVAVRSLDEFVGRATDFLNPLELYLMFEQARLSVPIEEFFRSSKTRHLKEAWHAAVFAIGYATFTNESVAVRICGNDPFPDFQLRVAGVIHDFECTSVVLDKPGERYAGVRTTGAPTVKPPPVMPVFDVDRLRDVVAAKVAKHYSQSVNLVVYLDAGGRLNLPSIAKAIDAGGGHRFSSVWVSGMEWMACTHSDGRLSAPSAWHATGIRPVLSDEIEPQPDAG